MIAPMYPCGVREVIGTEVTFQPNRFAAAVSLFALVAQAGNGQVIIPMVLPVGGFAGKVGIEICGCTLMNCLYLDFAVAIAVAFEDETAFAVAEAAELNPNADSTIPRHKTGAAKDAMDNVFFFRVLPDVDSTGDPSV